MANFSAADVKKLRELTGAGMMDCKKALDEADGDFDKAIEHAPHQGRGKGASAAPSARPPRPGRARSGGVARRAQLRDRLRRQGRRASVAAAERSRTPPPRPRPPTSRPLNAVDARRPDRRRGVDELAITIGEKIELGRVACFDGQVAPTCTSVPPTCRRRRRAGRVRRATPAAARRRDADRRDAPAVPHPRRGPGRGRGQGARDRRGHRPRGGQARAGDRQDHRGPA